MKTPRKLRLGVAPTRRVVLSIEEAGRQKRRIEEKLRSWGIDIVTIDPVNEEGLLYDRSHVAPALDIFRRADVDALFIPHVNFGTEDAAARLARDLGKPTLLWGPRDDAPLADGSRTRDTQCGLFATSKVLRRMGVPFSYIVNSTVDSGVFERGVKTFVGAAAAADAFRRARIGQVAPRPGAFWTMIVNEGELLERWGIEVVPRTLTEVLADAQALLDGDGGDLAAEAGAIQEGYDCSDVTAEQVRRTAALKLSIIRWAEEQDIDAIGLQCWSALQRAFQVYPCFVHGLITDEGIPMAPRPISTARSGRTWSRRPWGGRRPRSSPT